jgi:hypothetical protein
MNRNFSIRDAVFFELSGEALDVAGLLSVGFRPGISASVEMAWQIAGSNRQLQILFGQVEDFIIRGRDEEYPGQSGSSLSIAGFSNGNPNPNEPELFLEATPENNYMTFVMGDRSVLAVKAAKADMRQL